MKIKQRLCMDKKAVAFTVWLAWWTQHIVGQSTAIIACNYSSALTINLYIYAHNEIMKSVEGNNSLYIKDTVPHHPLAYPSL